ncbi:hypothetical protein BC629DRAFT_1589054 [Irpex lacteus]|nr:hypothetical protein BC629DRAFT_1589054 [Irpex lacteus]
MQLLFKLTAFAVFTALFVGTEAVPAANGLHKRTHVQPVNPLSNAQRLAQGFVLKRPQRRTAGRLHARVSATPTDSATPSSSIASESATPTDPASSSSVSATPTDPASSSVASSSASASSSAPSSSASPSSSSPASSSAAPSATPSTFSCATGKTLLRGHIRVQAQDNSFNSYLSATPNAFGEFGGTTNAIDEALIVHGCKPYVGLIELLFENAVGVTQPYLGFFKGFASTDASISYNSYNYMFLGGVQHTPVSSPETHDTSFGEDLPSESSVWMLDSSNRFNVQWINPDYTSPVPSIGYEAASQSIFITANFAQFTSNFGAATHVNLIYVPIAN